MGLDSSEKRRECELMGLRVGLLPCPSHILALKMQSLLSEISCYFQVSESFLCTVRSTKLKLWSAQEDLLRMRGPHTSAGFFLNPHPSTFFFFLIYFRERGREGERQGEKHRLVAFHRSSD